MVLGDDRIDHSFKRHGLGLMAFGAFALLGSIMEGGGGKTRQAIHLWVSG
jgi:hypothetical protein